MVSIFNLHTATPPIPSRARAPKAVLGTESSRKHSLSLGRLLRSVEIEAREPRRATMPAKPQRIVDKTNGQDSSGYLVPVITQDNIYEAPVPVSPSVPTLYTENLPVFRIEPIHQNYKEAQASGSGSGVHKRQGAVKHSSKPSHGLGHAVSAPNNAPVQKHLKQGKSQVYRPVTQVYDGDSDEDIFEDPDNFLSAETQQMVKDFNDKLVVGEKFYNKDFD